MRLRLRRLDDSEVELGVRNGRFVDPDSQDSDVVDLTHGYALPGLVDAHAHLQADGVEEMVNAGDSDVERMRVHAGSQLDAGVLVVADKGSKSDRTLEFLDVPPRDRPELHMAGEILVVEGGYYPNFGRVVDPDEVGKAAQQAASTRAEWVKLIGDWPRRGAGPQSNFSEEQIAAAVAAAHSQGARVAVHTMAPGTPSAAVRAGVDSIEHGLFLTERDVAALGKRRGAWVPTVAAMEIVAESLRPGSSGRRLILDGLDGVRENLPKAKRAGVHILAGTDLALRHGEVAYELQRLGDYGLSPSDVIESTILGGYEYLGTDTRLDVGGRADVVVVQADPRLDLAVLGSPVFIMRLGVVRSSSR